MWFGFITPEAHGDKSHAAEEVTCQQSRGFVTLGRYTYDFSGLAQRMGCF